MIMLKDERIKRKKIMPFQVNMGTNNAKTQLIMITGIPCNGTKQTVKKRERIIATYVSFRVLKCLVFIFVLSPLFQNLDG